MEQQDILSVSLKRKLLDQIVNFVSKEKLPFFLSEQDKKEYLFIYRYGGPGHQKVSQRWSFDWDHYLAGNRDFLVATLDVRGSGYSGDSFKHAVYKELGTYETQDTLKVIK